MQLQAGRRCAPEVGGGGGGLGGVGAALQLRMRAFKGHRGTCTKECAGNSAWTRVRRVCQAGKGRAHMALRAQSPNPCLRT